MKERYKFIIAVLIILSLTIIVNAATNVYTNGITTPQLNATANTANMVSYMKQDGIGQGLFVYKTNADSTYAAVTIDTLWGANERTTFGLHNSAAAVNRFYSNVNTTEHQAPLVEIIMRNESSNYPALVVRHYGDAWDDEIQEWWNATAKVAYLTTNGTLVLKNGVADFTPYYDKSIKPRNILNTHVDKDGKIDDASLHPFLQATCDEERITGYEYVMINGDLTEIANTEVVKVPCREVTNTVTVTADLLNAVVDQLCAEDDKRDFC